MSFSFYSVVNAIKDKSAEAMTTLSTDLQDFSTIVQEDVAEISKSVQQTIQERRESADKQDADASPASTAETDAKLTASSPEPPASDSQPATTSSMFSFDVGSALGSLHTVSSTVGSKLGALNVGSSLNSLETMGSKLLNSADEFLGTLTGDTTYDSGEELDEDELSARRFRLLALQEDTETYVDPPMDTETFLKWTQTTSSEDLAGIQAEVLAHYPTVGAKFTELVPSLVEADVFWAHYVYKASLLAAQEQRGADLLEHALNDSEEEIGWDVDSPKEQDDAKSAKNALFAEEEAKEEDEEEKPAAPAAIAPASGETRTGNSSSDGESWIELDERKESSSPGAGSSHKDAGASDALAGLKLEEGDEEGDEEGEANSLDWGDDDDMELATSDVVSEDKTPEVAAKTPATNKQGEDWGEWD